MGDRTVSLSNLNQTEIDKLIQDGFVSLGKLLTDEQVASINNKIAFLQASEGEDAGSELMESKYIRHPKEAGADRLADLVNKGKEFDVFYTHPKVIAGIQVVLGDEFKLSSLNYRAAKPGMGAQKLHVDWKDGLANGNYKVCNSIWLLDEFTTENGATRIVPGTHKLNVLPQDANIDLEASHPDEILITAPAGTVFIFNSHIWHGGTRNKTNKLRRSIHSYFCTTDQPQQINQKKYILDATKQRIGEEGMRILDVV